MSVSSAEESQPVPLAVPEPVAGIIRSPPRFDRERVVLYVAACLALALVSAVYVFGYLIPALGHAKAIVDAVRRDPMMSSGCYLLFMEHANRLLSAYAIRFLGMLIGIAVTFVGMLFTIKGIEAGYDLDVKHGPSGASLRTASPGLVLCTIGVGLVFAAVLHPTNLTFENIAQCVQQ